MKVFKTFIDNINKLGVLHFYFLLVNIFVIIYKSLLSNDMVLQIAIIDVFILYSNMAYCIAIIMCLLIPLLDTLKIKKRGNNE